MRRSLRGVKAARAALLVAISAAIAGVAPSSCVYPDYTFNELEPTGGGAGGGGGSAPGVEDCQNMVDDDNDGDADCADSDCQGAGFVCVAGIPLGWSGYQSLYVGPPSGAPTSCPTKFPSPIPYVGNATPTADPATCTACTCAPPAGEKCDLPDTLTVSATLCPAANPMFPQVLSVPPDWDGSCNSGDVAPGGLMNCNGNCNRSVKAEGAVVVGGSCQTNGGAPTVPPVVWALQGTACGDAAQGGGCDAGQACQPSPAAPFQPGLCIFRSGDQDCPGAPFTDKHVFYEGTDDTRGCTACSCGGPMGATCSANITVYADGGCSMGGVTFATGACGLLSGNPAVASWTAQLLPINAGTCPASGGEPTGDFVPSQPSTFCCIP